MRFFVIVFLWLMIFQLHGLVASSEDNVEMLIEASEKGDIVTMKALISKGENINRKSKNGRTALIVSALSGRDAGVQLLLENGANVNEKMDNGLTALMAAALSKSETALSIMKRLIAAGADVDAMDIDGRTALMAAVMNNNIDKVDLLVSSNANVHIKNKRGLTAQNYATVTKNTLILEALKKADKN